MAPDARRLLERFARAERGLRDSELVAPVLPGGSVAVRVSGLVARLTVTPSHHRGWALLRADGAGRAAVVRAASLSETSKYLAPLPRYRFLLVERAGERWVGLPVTGDARLKSDVLYPLGLVDEGERFDAVCARFDGGSFWFECSDHGSDPSRAAWLREQLDAEVAPDALDRGGLTPADHAVFGHLFLSRSARRADTERARVERAVKHAGGTLLRVEPHGTEMNVHYEVDGRPHASSVRSSDLTVLSAGICLDGGDSDFDLASLISVIRESENDH